jgi:hypothetical protein
MGLSSTEITGKDFNLILSKLAHFEALNLTDKIE